MSELIRHGRCGKTWTGKTRGHCAQCHETFTSGAFDKHRTISGGVVTCHPPAGRGLVARDMPWGVLWGMPGGYWNGEEDAEGDA